MKKLIPITLGIARRQARSAQPPSDKGQKQPDEQQQLELRQKVFERDNFTCRCCGFHALKYQDVHFINNNHADWQMDNLATACMFCHQCFNLEQVGDMRSGVLIWMPEIAQPDLHNLARAIYVARISQGPMAETARKALEVIMSRREEAIARLGTDDPFILSMVMQDYLSAQHYARRREKLEGIRLFPLDRRIINEGELEFNQFPQILAYWRSKEGPFGGQPSHQWKETYAALLAEA